MLTSSSRIASDGAVIKANAVIVYEKIVGAACLSMSKPLGVGRRPFLAHCVAPSSEIGIFAGTATVLGVFGCAVGAFESPEFRLACTSVLPVWRRDLRTLKKAVDKPAVPTISDLTMSTDIGVHALAGAIDVGSEPACVQFGVKLACELIDENRQPGYDERRNYRRVERHLSKKC